jgi:transglutaminase-like putative cysteine protease
MTDKKLIYSLFAPVRTGLQITVIFFLLFLLLSCTAKAPVISSIDPKIGRMGELITLTGSNFGESREESYITIAGVAPTSSSYQQWQDDLIIVRVPELGDSGLVYVHVKGRRSNGVLFSNIAAVPRPIEGEEFGFEPRITSVSPQTGAPGVLITITGNNFGTSRDDGGVFFSWDYHSTSFNPFAVREPEFIEVSETELGYESWSAREIRIRLPDGAISGNMEIRTANGRSRPVFFDVTGKPGYKNFTDRRTYTIRYSVDIRVLEASRPNNLYLWMPRPVSSPSQRNVTLISRNVEPFIENHRGVSLFKLDNLPSGTNHSINLSYSVEVFAQETGMRPVYIRNEQIPLHSLYTQSSNLIPSDNQQIRTQVNTIIGREQNTFQRARLIYNWIINNMQITENLDMPVAGVIEAFEQRHADPYHAALLYAAMARAARIPCIPVAGVLINRNGQTLRHYWVEFWIDSFGWLPADPAMGAGAVPESYISKQDLQNFYFGNMDNHRIAFSRGELSLMQMESRGRLVSHPQSYSLQNIWEEAAGGLESYSSLWGDIIITGIYR